MCITNHIRRPDMCFILPHTVENLVKKMQIYKVSGSKRIDSKLLKDASRAYIII